MKSQLRVLILTGVGLEAAHLQVSPAPPSSCLDSCDWSQESNVSFIYSAIKGPTCGGKPLAGWPGKAARQDLVSSCSQRAPFGPTPCSITLPSSILELAVPLGVCSGSLCHAGLGRHTWAWENHSLPVCVLTYSWALGLLGWFVLC